MKKISLGALALSIAAGLATSATAQISPIPAFTGQFSEIWATAGSGFPECVENGVFSGQGTLCTFDLTTGAPTGGAHVTSGWGFSCSISPFVPSRLFGSASGAAEYNFMQPVGRFGGYFGSNSANVISAGGGTITFFDANNVELGQVPLPISTCGTWDWHGWEFTVPVVRIRTASNAFGGAFLMMDAMEMDPFTGGPACYANCDGSTVPPILNVDDFTCFINEFAAAQPLPHAQQLTHYANCDSSTVAPVLNVDDFTCFINAFAQGCP